MQSIFELSQISNARGCCLAAICLSVRIWRTGCTSAEVSISVSQNQKSCHLFCHLSTKSFICLLHTCTHAAVTSYGCNTYLLASLLQDFSPPLCLCLSQEDLFQMTPHSIAFYSIWFPHSEPDPHCHPHFIMCEALQSSPTLKNLEKVENLSRTEQIFQCKPRVFFCWLFFLLYFSVMNSAHGDCLVHPDKSRPDEQAGL